MMAADIERVPAKLFEFLRRMDAEADGQRNGWPIGLLWYCHHERSLKPERVRKRDDIEDSWCRRLAELVRAETDWAADTFTRYPSGKISDLVIRFPDASSIWIEIKGAWSYVNNHDVHGKVLWDDAKKYLYGRPNRCVESDVRKMDQLTPNLATYCGALLLGFDAAEPAGYQIQDEHLNEFRRKALTGRAWREEYDEWPDSHQNNGPERAASSFRVRCWFWHRKIE